MCFSEPTTIVSYNFSQFVSWVEVELETEGFYDYIVLELNAAPFDEKVSIFFLRTRCPPLYLRYQKSFKRQVLAKMLRFWGVFWQALKLENLFYLSNLKF